MSKQMGSLFDFERVCKNCRWYNTGPDEPGQVCDHPDRGFVWTDEDMNCDKWETKHNYASTYLMGKDGEILEKGV